MAKCNGGKCSITCPGGCGCVSDAKTGECLGCFCSGGGKGKFGDFKPTVLTPINISAHQITLADFAAGLNRLYPNRIAVPAANVHKKLTLELKNTTFTNAINKLGLKKLR
jgi:hypothetical protein